MNTLKILGCLLWMLFSTSLFSQATEQVDSDKELQIEIMEMDSLLFDVAFNTCDLAIYKKLFAEDFEFYDDRSGLNTSIDKEVMSFKDRCSKPFSVTRKLVSSDAYVLGDFGAVQTGEHDFYVDGEKVQKAKFITVWERRDGSWVVKRAISYEHTDIETPD